MSQTAFSNHKVFDAIFLFVHHLCVRVLYHFEPATVSNKRFRLHMTAVLFFLSLFFYLSRFPKIWLNQKLRSKKKRSDLFMSTVEWSIFDPIELVIALHSCIIWFEWQPVVRLQFNTNVYWTLSNGNRELYQLDFCIEAIFGVSFCITHRTLMMTAEYLWVIESQRQRWCV